ncbi:MAG: S-layer domain protein, partial [Capsulimonas sp.]|nr:S-layer domain protein [Capsulimonas sp.]
DVERRQLENRQEFAEAGIRLEVEKLRIQADKEVQQEFAKALGQFLSKGNMTLYGTPETAQKMMDNMAKGFGIRAMADGFLGGATPQNGANGHSPTGSGPSPVDNLIGSLGKLVGPVVEKLTGQPLDNEAQADAIAKALAGNPAALKAIADALGASDPTPVVKASEPIVVKSVSANGAVSEKPAVIVTSAGSEAN